MGVIYALDLEYPDSRNTYELIQKVLLKIDDAKLSAKIFSSKSLLISMSTQQHEQSQMRRTAHWFME